MEKNVIIAHSKGKLIRFCLIGLIFFAGGLWIILTDPQVGNPIFNSIFIKAFSGYGGVLFGVLGFWFYVKKLMNGKPGLIINEKGVYNNVVAFVPRFISWKHIASVEEYSMKAGLASPQYFVSLQLKDPNAFIAEIPNSFTRTLMRINRRFSGTPVNLTANSLKITHKELLAAIKDAFARYNMATTAET
ncbi:MAG: hypothetical protein NTW29_11520 [Bacteroidetes bacterium]|nr:hypothetical protein [Bacteroidota bacterium]